MAVKTPDQPAPVKAVKPAERGAREPRALTGAGWSGTGLAKRPMAGHRSDQVGQDG